MLKSNFPRPIEHEHSCISLQSSADHEVLPQAPMGAGHCGMHGICTTLSSYFPEHSEFQNTYGLKGSRSGFVGSYWETETGYEELVSNYEANENYHFLSVYNTPEHRLFVISCNPTIYQVPSYPVSVGMAQEACRSEVVCHQFMQSWQEAEFRIGTQLRHFRACTLNHWAMLLLSLTVGKEWN